MNFRRSPHLSYVRSVRLANALSAIMPIRSFQTGVSFAKSMEFRYREIFSYVADNYQFVTDVTPDQAQEFATLFFRNQMESYLAENRLCAMSKKPFTEYASRSILKSLSKEQLLEQLKQSNVSCKDVSFTILGLSLATINIVLSFILSLVFLILFINYRRN